MAVGCLHEVAEDRIWTVSGEQLGQRFHPAGQVDDILLLTSSDNQKHEKQSILNFPVIVPYNMLLHSLSHNDNYYEAHDSRTLPLYGCLPQILFMICFSWL